MMTSHTLIGLGSFYGGCLVESSAEKSSKPVEGKYPYPKPTQVGW